MTTRKHDYQSLEAEWTRLPDKISYRELARRHGIKSYSAIAAYAKEHHWEDKRDDIMGRKDAKVAERVSAQLAEAEADMIETVRGEWLTVIRAATYKFAEDLKNPNYTLRVDDLVKLIDKGLVLLGEPSSRTEERHLALSGSLDGLPEPVLRAMAERTRPLSVARVGANLPTRADPEGTRSN